MTLIFFTLNTSLVTIITWRFESDAVLKNFFFSVSISHKKNKNNCDDMIISVFLPKDFKDANKTLITSMYKTTRVHKVISRDDVLT